jgi:hypothetical protein
LVWFLIKIFLHFFLCSVRARFPSALRSAHVVRLEGDAAPGAGNLLVTGAVVLDVEA